MKPFLTIGLLCLGGVVYGQDFSVTGRLENTIWVSDNIPAGFLEFDDGVLYEPSATFHFDYQPNEKFYFHGTLNIDKGEDPGAEPDGDIRFDLLFLRYRPFGDNTINFQAGKFATVVGNWVPENVDNPFLLAPLPYASITGVNTQDVLQNSPQQIENRFNSDGNTIYENKTDWAALVWGPAYANGFAVFGSVNQLDYAAELKSSSIGSAPDERSLGEGDFRDPQFSGRLGYRVNAGFSYGLSLSHGPYLDEDAQLAPGIERDDLNQTLVGLDARWSHRDWIVSGEAFFAQFDRLDEEDLRVFSYYLQARYKLAPGVWLAGRVGQTLSNEVEIPSGGDAPWSPNLFRGELAVGWRITPELVVKAQYTYTEVTNDFSSSPSPHLYGISMSWNF